MVVPLELLSLRAQETFNRNFSENPAWTRHPNVGGEFLPLLWEQMSLT